MSYWTIGEEGTVAWTGLSFYSNLIGAMNPARATIRIGNEVQDVTGLNALAAVNIPGLKSSVITIGGFAGSTPYLGNAGNIAYSAGGYAVDVFSAQFNARCKAVHDITKLGATPTWRSFRPGIFSCSSRYSCGVDSATALVMPPDAAAALPTITHTYKSGATIAVAGVLNELGAGPVVNQKNTVDYGIAGSSTAVCAGGIFGTYTFGAQQDPVWSGPTATLAPIVITTSSGKTLTVPDAFWSTLSVRWAVGSPVYVEMTAVGSGAVVAA